jgi:SAM-dependent methyltransferase
MNIRPVVKGLLTFVPGVRGILPRGHTGGTSSASYCLGVWRKHLGLLRAAGLGAPPATLAELGPGDSIGVGLAALLSGVDRYVALDVVRFSDTRSNLEILDDLVRLLAAEGSAPDGERVARVRRALVSGGSAREGVEIGYMVPWTDERVIEAGSIDVILSHAVLEHVIDLDGTYRALARWLKPGGMMSHQIDFRSHGITKEWNGYRAYPELLWKIIAGRRAYLINREPCSSHLALIAKHGFTVVSVEKQYNADGIARSRLARRWKGISDDDLSCFGLIVQARKG